MDYTLQFQQLIENQTLLQAEFVTLNNNVAVIENFLYYSIVLSITCLIIFFLWRILKIFM
jgi:hypothetical protein